MNTFVKVVFSLVFGFVLAIGCGEKKKGTESVKPIVFVSIPPQAFFVEKIAGGSVIIEVLVGKGQEPHTFAPTPRQVSALGRARLFFTIGVPFEQMLVDKLDDTRLSMVDTSADIARRNMKEHDHDEHEAEAHHDEHAGDDPHIWLDPLLVKPQAASICAALKKLLPAEAEVFEANLQAFEKELTNLHTEIETILKPYRGRTFYVFHPSFGYFGDRYGLKQEAVEMEGKTPGPRQLAQLIRQARKEGVQVLFVQPQFSARAAEKIAAEIGGSVVPLDIMGRDYYGNLKAMAAGLKAGFERVE